MALRMCVMTMGHVRLQWVQTLTQAPTATYLRTLSTEPEPSQSSGKAPISFDDYERVFKGQPSITLVRTLVVFRACSIPWFVQHAGQLLKLSRAVLGENLTMKLVKHTFYNQFCAGETDEELQRKVLALRSRGIGSILDYAAEDDVPSPPKSDSKSDKKPDKGPEASKRPQPPAAGASSDVSTSTQSPAPAAPAAAASGGAEEAGLEAKISPNTGKPVLLANGAVARQYTYTTESQCDAHVKIFLSCIDSASKAPGRGGFAAVKLTALGNPLLLERVSSAIREVRGLFKRWDTDGNGFIDREEFNKAYSVLLPDATDEERQRVFTWMDLQKEGQVDWVAWCQRLSLSTMPEIAARIKSGGDPSDTWQESLRAAALTPEEVKLVGAIRARLAILADAAAKAGVKLLIDAEHTYFQPAIDHLTMELMRKYNTGKDGAVVYNTSQAYLKDSEKRVTDKLERARREKYILGVKLVRGAYMEIERARAAAMGYPSPVWDNIQQTHDCYNRNTKTLLSKVKEGRAEVLLGTHNQGSIELAVSHMAELGLDPGKSAVYFGQLLGMSDHLTQGLGGAGYNAYKYTPYGRVAEVIPYLLRRASENASIMKGTKRDVVLVQAELWRRAKAAVGMQAKAAGSTKTA